MERELENGLQSEKGVDRSHSPYRDEDADDVPPSIPLLSTEGPSSSNSLPEFHEKPNKSRRLKVTIPLPSDIQSSKRAKGVPGWYLALGVVGMLAVGYIISYFVTSTTRYGHDKKVNVILMISDGFGPTSETYARSFLQSLSSSPPPSSLYPQWSFPDTTPSFISHNSYSSGYGVLPLDEILVGSSRTRSSDSLVTDSAAGATAFSCGFKTYNGAIGVEPVGKGPRGTVLEAAKYLNYHTGLVVTSRITHATPASFYAHVPDRDMESEIATFLAGLGPLGLQVDLAFGGGRCYFLPSSAPNSCRHDDRDLLKEINNRGGEVLSDWDELEGLEVKGRERGKGFPLVGLWANDHLEFEMDRRLDNSGKQPSLKDMAMKAIDTLSTVADKGFFLMIEGSRIDMAAHSNDPVGHMGDILAYQETVAAVKKWVDEANAQGKDTVMISVSDHETGGLSLGVQLDPNVYPEYRWFPDVIFNATHSTSWLGRKLASVADPSDEYIKREILEKGLGIADVGKEEMKKLKDGSGNAYRNERLLADMISRRAQLGWSTSGHSGVDVNLYAYGYQAEKLRGNHENTDISDFIVEIMGLDLNHITKELTRNLNSWYSPESKKHPGGPQAVIIDHYHNDF